MNKIISLTICLLLIFSCKKNQLGGKSKINGSVVHHNTAIPFASVFIKFNATEFPGKDTAKYDSKVRADAAGKFSVDCYKGDYYIYAVGIDNGAQDPEVRGGVPVKLRHKEVVDITVPVSGQH
jgi:hypothetical protein